MFPVYLADLRLKRIGEHITRNEDRKRKQRHERGTDKNICGLTREGTFWGIVRKHYQEGKGTL